MIIIQNSKTGDNMIEKINSAEDVKKLNIEEQKQ